MKQLSHVRDTHKEQLWKKFIRMTSRWSTCGKKKSLLFFPLSAWMTVFFFWWLESSYGLSQRICFGARICIGGAVLGKKRFLVSTVFDWYFFCQWKLFFRQRKFRVISLISHAGGLGMEAIVMWDSERGVAAPWSELAIGAPVMWPPQRQRHVVFLNSPIALQSLTMSCVCILLSKSALALQCNPVCT